MLALPVTALLFGAAKTARETIRLAGMPTDALLFEVGEMIRLAGMPTDTLLFKVGETIRLAGMPTDSLLFEVGETIGGWRGCQPIYARATE